MLTYQETFDRVSRYVATHYEVDMGRLSANTSFISDLGLDSLDMTEMVIELEAEFGIVIPDVDASEMNTIGEAAGRIVQIANAREDLVDKVAR